MYTEFYKLTGQPFQLTPDHRFFYNSSVHKRALAHLTFGLSQSEGFIVITGDVGAGKTTLMGHLLSTLDSDRYISATLVTTQLAADDMLRMVASAFGLEQEQADKATLLRRIESFCEGAQAEGKNCLLLVDEVQNLSFEALEELRMLSNFQTDGRALLQSILLGQPQFRRTLASRDLDQLRQRVIASYHLGPISEPETREYIRHRLHAVGWNNDPALSEDAFAEVYKQTGGVPRRINVLCSRLLLYGFLDELHQIDGHAVAQVAHDLQQETEQVLDTGEAAPPAPSVPENVDTTVAPAPIAALREPRVPAVDTVSDTAADTTVAAPLAVPNIPLGAPARGARPELVRANDRDAPDTKDDSAAPARPGDDGRELAALRLRLENMEAQMQRHDRMLRWTQLMLKHHERMLRRRIHKAISNAG